MVITGLRATIRHVTLPLVGHIIIATWLVVVTGSLLLRLGSLTLFGHGPFITVGLVGSVIHYYTWPSGISAFGANSWH